MRGTRDTFFVPFGTGWKPLSGVGFQRLHFRVPGQGVQSCPVWRDKCAKNGRKTVGVCPAGHAYYT